VYTVTVQCEDDGGNQTTGSVTVLVPKSMDGEPKTTTVGEHARPGVAGRASRPASARELTRTLGIF